MNLQERINEAQQQANGLAIQESNLRAQLEQVAGLKQQLKRVIAEKNKFIGMIIALQSLQTEEAKSINTDPPATA